MNAVWDYTFSWLDPSSKILVLGFITFAFLIAIIKFIKR